MWWVVTGAVAVLALAAGVLVVVRDDAPRTDVVVPVTGTPPATGSPVDPSVPPGGPGDIGDVVAELSRFVEDQRGLQFLEPVEVTLLDDAGFRARLLSDLSEEVDDIRLSERLLVALGVIEPGTDLVALQEDLLGAGVVGFYDPETGELVVRGAEPTPYVRETIVHELTHALDDQHFELDRPEIDEEGTDDASLAFAGLVEGVATWVDEAYRSSLSPAEQREAFSEELALGSDLDVSRFPTFFITTLVFPYQAGPPFVEALVNRGGTAAIDAAYDRPPGTTEQVRHPEAYFTGEDAVEVPPPPAEGPVIDEGVMGEAVIFALLADVDPVVANSAATGWGGDRYVAWDAGDGRTCVRVAAVGDSEGDTRELEAGFRALAAGHDDAVVGRDGSVVVLTACG